MNIGLFQFYINMLQPMNGSGCQGLMLVRQRVSFTGWTGLKWTHAHACGRKDFRRTLTKDEIRLSIFTPTKANYSTLTL